MIAQVPGYGIYPGIQFTLPFKLVDIIKHPDKRFLGYILRFFFIPQHSVSQGKYLAAKFLVKISKACGIPTFEVID